MNREQAKEQAKTFLKDYANQKLTKDPKLKDKFVCPFCGSGTGKNGTAALAIDDKSGGIYWRCFSCGEHGDIFDLVGKVENLPNKKDAFERVYSLYGLKIDNTPETGVLKAQEAKKEKTAPLTPYFDELQRRQKTDETYKSDYLTNRGISREIQDRFNIGYEENYTTGTGGKVWQAVIIPTSDYSYTARNTDVTASKNDRLRKHGETAIFNVEALKTATKPIFIVEGEIDALSVIEAGADAIALGSTANLRTFLKAIDETRPRVPLILALDQDEPGRKAENNLSQELEARRIHYYRMNISGSYKDPNEALMQDRNKFIQDVKNAKNIEYLEEQKQQARKNDYYAKTCAHAYLQDFINGIGASIDTPAISTGFKQLDDVLDGGLYEGLYICGAISSLGKTTFILQMADQIAQSGQDVLIFSLEMARNELISKSVSRLTVQDELENRGKTKNAKTARGITAGKRYKYYSREEQDLIQRAFEAYEQYANHIYIVEGVGDIGVQEVRKQVEKHIELTGRKPVVIVDYVQILAPYNERATDKQNTDKNIVELKRLSRDYKIPVIGISSFNRDSYNSKVSMAAFKESGAIEYGSDCLIALQLKGAGTKDFDVDEAKRKEPREIVLKILKNRNGATGNEVNYKYYPRFNYFKEEVKGE